MVICFTRTLIFTSDEIILKIYIERILLLPIIHDKLTVSIILKLLSQIVPFTSDKLMILSI